MDGGTPVEVDTYSPTVKFQQVVFTAAGLADANHTLTITTTGSRNPAASAPRIVVDAFDVMTLGRRYENRDPAITYTDDWIVNHTSRIWSGGSAAVSNTMGDTVAFRFTGTSVSGSAPARTASGGRQGLYRRRFVNEVRLSGVRYPQEGYQMTVFRADGLANGPHTLTIEVTSWDTGPYVVVDAFDVHPRQPIPRGERRPSRPASQAPALRPRSPRLSKGNARTR